MEWFKVLSGASRHPKVIKLAAVMGIPRVQALGHVVALWDWTATHRERGDLSGMEPIDVVIGAQWEGPADAFFDALVRCRLVEDRGPEGLVVHDWIEIQGPALEARDAGRERARNWRKNRGQKTNANDEPENAHEDDDEREAYAYKSDANAVASRQASKQASKQALPPKPPTGGHEGRSPSATRFRAQDLTDDELFEAMAHYAKANAANPDDPVARRRYYAAGYEWRRRNDAKKAESDQRTRELQP